MPTKVIENKPSKKKYGRKFLQYRVGEIISYGKNAVLHNRIQ
jgi:hypothetical protein